MPDAIPDTYSNGILSNAAYHKRMMAFVAYIEVALNSFSCFPSTSTFVLPD